MRSEKSPDHRQALVEVDFRADILSASLAKADSNALEVPLGDVTLNHFALRFSTATYDMKADLKLRYACDMRKGLASYPTGRYP